MIHSSYKTSWARVDPLFESKHLTRYGPVMLFYTTWKQKTFRFFVFRGYKKATPDCNGLKCYIFQKK